MSPIHHPIPVMNWKVIEEFPEQNIARGFFILSNSKKTKTAKIKSPNNQSSSTPYFVLSTPKS